MIRKIRELLHPKGFYDALWPYRYFSMVFTHCNTESKKWRAIYTIFIVTAYLPVSYFVGYGAQRFVGREEISNVQTAIVYFVSGFELCVIPMHTLMWFFVGHSYYIEIVSSITILDRDMLQLCLRHVNLSSMVIRQLICMVLSVSISAILNMGQNFGASPGQTNRSRAVIGAINYFAIVINIVMTFFGNLVYFIGDRYVLVNSALKEIDVVKRGSNSSKVDYDEATLTRQLRIIHRKLFFISRKITKAFGFQLLVSTFTSLTFTVNDSYNLYRSVASYCGELNVPGIVILNIGIVNDLAHIIYLSYCCHRTVREANRTTKILNSMITSHSEDLRLEVSSFSYQLMHYQLHFSPHGFFQLDLALVQNMFGSVATYLVILVQLESLSLNCDGNTTVYQVYKNQSTGTNEYHEYLL